MKACNYLTLAMLDSHVAGVVYDYVCKLCYTVVTTFLQTEGIHSCSLNLPTSEGCKLYRTSLLIHCYLATVICHLTTFYKNSIGYPFTHASSSNWLVLHTYKMLSNNQPIYPKSLLDQYTLIQTLCFADQYLLDRSRINTDFGK